MIDIQKKLYINSLLDQYKGILTSRQQSIMNQYYVLDYSLAEIADIEKISRQAVHDTITKAENALLNIESKLHLVSKFNNLKTEIIKVTKQLNDEMRNKIVGIIDKI